jgi:hypothetical protein
MPFCCGKRSAGTCVVLGPKQSRPPHHLGGAHKHGATYSSHRAPSTYSLGKERVHWVSRLGRCRVGRVRQRLGRAGVIGCASGFSSLQPRICRPLLSRNEGLLGQSPSMLKPAVTMHRKPPGALASPSRWSHATLSADHRAMHATPC